jgi:iron-sulfur cluster assembly accessory protein
MSLFDLIRRRPMPREIEAEVRPRPPEPRGGRGRSRAQRRRRRTSSPRTTWSDESEPVIPPPRLELSQAAVERIREMLEEEDLVEEGGLRIAARTGAGCSAPMLFNLVLEAEAREDDVVLEGPGIRLFMDPVSAWSLDGLAVDWVDAPGLGEGFAFRHPRGAGGRAC